MIEIEKILNHKFNNIQLIKTALTHKSFANDNKIDSYERLEFLGDAILEAVVSNELYIYHNLSEGELTKLRSKIVSAAYLCEVCNKLNLTKFIVVGNSIKTIPSNIKADVIESIIASLYLDSGYDLAYKFIVLNVLPSLEELDKIAVNVVDYKSILQEKFQSKSENFVYILKNTTGPAHDLTFEVELMSDNKKLASSTGKSLKEAEQKCAKIAINKLYD